MLKKGILICITTFSLILDVNAQALDTLRVMTYNLMYYRENPTFCTNNTNANTRDGYVKTILDHTNVDVLVVNEMGVSQAVAPFRLLTNAVNQSGRSFDFSYNNVNSQQQGLQNVVYYDSSKLTLKSQTAISKDLSNQDLVRIIDLYTFYHKDSGLSQHQDTAFIHLMAAHLKAGSGTADQQERAKATNAVMNYLDQNNLDGNVLFAGDLNLYRSNEAAYQNLINYSAQAHRFYDPVNISGNWANSVYAFLHTQSTHSSSAGCFAGGGMDNRFDFILASDEIMNGTNRVQYISNSYETLGQDGNRYNGALNSPTNNSAPANVINALYRMSDHLPVLLDLEIKVPNSTSLKQQKAKVKISYQNPTQGDLRLKLGNNGALINGFLIKDMSGNVVKEQAHDGTAEAELNLNDIANGVYFLYLRMNNGNQQVEKLIKI